MENSQANPEAPLAALSPEQREQVEQWLFDEKLPFTDVEAKVLGEFNLKLTHESLELYYKHNVQARNVLCIERGRNEANNAVKMMTDDPEATFRKIISVVGDVAFKMATECKESGETVAVRELVKVLISARRAEIYARKFYLEREKWEIDVARICLAHFADLQAITVDASVDEEARLQAIRRQLFGPNLPD